MGSFLMIMFAYVWVGYVLFMYKPDMVAIHVIFDGLVCTTMISMLIFIAWLFMPYA
jgi:hypothetical protein